MRYAMAIDLDRCIGCRTCAVICKDHNAEPRGIWWNRVFAPARRIWHVGDRGRHGA